VKKHTFTTLMRRLSRAGFKKEFVYPAILPNWWDKSCSEDPSLLQDIELRVARFLDLPLAVVKDASASLAPPEYPEAQLRRVRDMDRNRLLPAIHSAMRIGAAVVRSLRNTVPDPAVPPADGLEWRELVKAAGPAVTLHDIVADLWKRGIPVVPLDVLPGASFQAIACIVERRPVILLGYKHDEPGRAAYLVAHEVGHVVAGDCAPDRPVVDEEEAITDDADIECRADQYGTRVLIGGDTVPEVAQASFKDLARQASQLEGRTGADASTVIFAWARRTNDYATATMAVKALYRGTGARKQLCQLFDLHVNVAAAAETDRALLRCVHGELERDEVVG
jgi:hypothetical protein